MSRAPHVPLRRWPGGKASDCARLGAEALQPARPRRAIHMRVNNGKCHDLYGVFAMTPDGLLIFLSSFGPKETMDRLAAAVANRGVTILARINRAAARDHARGDGESSASVQKSAASRAGLVRPTAGDGRDDMTTADFAIAEMTAEVFLVSYELTGENTCEESCGRGGGGVQPWAC